MDNDTRKKMVRIAMSGSVAYNLLLTTESLAIARYLLKIELMRKVAEGLVDYTEQAKAADFVSLNNTKNLAGLVGCMDSYMVLDQSLMEADIAFQRDGVHKVIAVIPTEHFESIKKAIDRDLDLASFPQASEEEAGQLLKDWERVRPLLEEVRKLFADAKAEMEEVQAEAKKIVDDFRNQLADEKAEESCPTGCEGCGNQCGVDNDLSSDDDGELLN